MKLSLELKKRARNLFESGMDMFEIHQQLKINLGSLYNLSSKEGWEKGKRKELIHLLETEEELTELKAMQQEVITDYMEIARENREILKEIQKEHHMAGRGRNKIEVRSLIKYKSETYSNYVRGTLDNYKLESQLYNILTPYEKIKLDMERVKYEALKKKLDIELNKDDSEVEL